MRSLRQRIENIRADENGEYRYSGKTYGAAHAPTGLFFSLIAGELILILLSGLIPTPGTMNRVYVIVPYVLELCFACWVTFGLARLGRDYTALRDYQYDYVKVMPGRCLLTIIAALAGFMGEALSALISREQLPNSILYLALRLLSAASMILFRKRWTALRWQERT